MLKSLLKNIILKTLTFFDKKYLFEYFQIKKNEGTLLPPIQDFYTDFVKPGMKIVDVGVNVGNYSRVFVNMGAKVIGLEPQKYCLDILKKRFKNESNFKVIPAASGASESQGQIHKSDSHTIASMNENWINTVKDSKRFEGEDWDQTETIQITTLDKVIQENFLPDYIKIDVEGFELEVLKGLHQAVDFISFEITLPEMTSSAVNCVNEIMRIGNYQFVIPDKAISKIDRWYSQTEILEQLNTLGRGTAKISSDIFCKKI